MQCWFDSKTAHALSLIHSPGGFIKLLWRSTLHHHSSSSSSFDNNNNIIMSSQQNPAEPPNFSWVEPCKLAGLARPTMVHHYRYLLDHGIKHLVSLLEIKPPNYEKCPELSLHQISIVDFTPPSRSQILQFLSIVEKANAKGEVRETLILHPALHSSSFNYTFIASFSFNACV